MSFKNAFLFNLQSETSLRDARHANQIYTQNNFAFSPKVKYMYHVRFDPTEEVGNNATSNVFKFQKELGILVKSADLPSFRASVENKQQYNRRFLLLLLPWMCLEQHRKKFLENSGCFRFHFFQ